MNKWKVVAGMHVRRRAIAEQVGDLKPGDLAKRDGWRGRADERACRNAVGSLHRQVDLLAVFESWNWQPTTDRAWTLASKIYDAAQGPLLAIALSSKPRRYPPELERARGYMEKGESDRAFRLIAEYLNSHEFPRLAPSLDVGSALNEVVGMDAEDFVRKMNDAVSPGSAELLKSNVIR